MTTIVYPERMSPSELSFYDGDTDIIYIDKKLKDVPIICTKVIIHETKHATSKSLIDIKQELYGTFTPKELLQIVKLKPLTMLAGFQPIVYCIDNNKLIYGVELFRVLLIIISILTSASLFWIANYIL